MFSLNFFLGNKTIGNLNSGVVKMPSYHEDKKGIAIVGYP
jgi:hypothetical protein